MSLIEHALQKSRAAEAGKSRRADDPNGERTLGRTQQGAAVDPALRIRPIALAVDRDLCRERRVLLEDAAEHDGAAVAAYRMLRTRLVHRARMHQWTTIAVTSACPNDGKTLTGLNLALSLAREKSREVVLLDMDMRSPSVCRTLGVQPGRELRDYLEHGGSTSDMFFSVGSDNLLIAGSTSPTEHASELLASPKFEQLIGDLKRGTVNPIVLIDLPPVLATDDMLVVAPKIDAILVVASERLTDRAALTKALNLLSEFPLAGLVLNRAIDATPGYGYGYGYGVGDTKRTEN